jgi:hypothetical protein
MKIQRIGSGTRSITVSRGEQITAGRFGHAHFWERAISRRDAIKIGAGSAAMVFGSGLFGGILSSCGGDDSGRPKPIPGGIAVNGVGFHVFAPPGPSNPVDPNSPIQEPSTITDFEGAVGIAQVDGMGIATDLNTGLELPVTFDCDMRFMQGDFIGEDGDRHSGTFGFI